MTSAAGPMTLVVLFLCLTGCATGEGNVDRFGRVPWTESGVLVSRYERTPTQVFQAADSFARHYGRIVASNSETGELNLRWNGREIRIIVEPDDLMKGMTAVSIEARSPEGREDRGMVAEVDKQIALWLPR